MWAELPSVEIYCHNDVSPLLSLGYSVNFCLVFEFKHDLVRRISDRSSD